MKVDLTLLKKINKNISKGRTGSPECFAKAMGISRRNLYLYIEFLKTKFDAPIAYSRSNETFYFTEEWKFYIGNLIPIKTGLLKELLEIVENLEPL